MATRYSALSVKDLQVNQKIVAIKQKCG